MKSDFVLLGEKSQSLDVVLVSIWEIHTGTYKLKEGRGMSVTDKERDEKTNQNSIWISILSGMHRQ